MPATSREQNVAALESRTNQVWEEAYESLLENEDEALRTHLEVEMVQSAIGQKYQRAAILLDIAAARLLLEGVRRGVLPEQEVPPIDDVDMNDEANTT